MKQLISRRSFLKAAGVTAAAASMAIGAPAASACWYGDKSDVTILYTNDVHTYIDKQSPKLTYAAIADLKQSYQNAGKDVLLVDAGDHVQGTAYGSMDEGASIIKLMNAAGYDVATPGNHEFDYGMDRAKMVLKEADFPYVSCNWIDLRSGLRVLPSIKLFNIHTNSTSNGRFCCLCVLLCCLLILCFLDSLLSCSGIINRLFIFLYIFWSVMLF